MARSQRCKRRILNGMHSTPSGSGQCFSALPRVALVSLAYPGLYYLSPLGTGKGGDLDAASAGFRVGYEDPSYFSREYKKLFGAPPQRDIAALRNNLAV